MGLDKKTIKIIAIVVASVIVSVVVLGLLLGLLLKDEHIELEVWPRAADGGAQPFISYASRERDSYLTWTKRIDGFLAGYLTQNRPAQNLFVCDYSNKPPNQRICDIPLRELAPCVAENNYGYNRGQPCVFLRLNKILNWTPKFYNVTEDLPENMPEELKQNIKDVVGRPEANEVWVSCEGEGPADKEFIGPLRYYPQHGFPEYFFSTTNAEGYLSPLVAVQFQRIYSSVVINVVCKAWAKNIACDGCEQTASVHFQLLVD